MNHNLKNILIIGGTSSIAFEIINSFNNLKYNIYSTYKNIDKMNEKNKQYNYNLEWLYLDIDSIDSVYHFINNIKNKYFSYIIFLSATTTEKDFLDMSDKEIKNFYSNYTVNSMILAKYMLNQITNDGKIIYISSIAANQPVSNINYGVGKGTLQSFFMCLSTKVQFDQSIISIVPGLIYDTPSFYAHNIKDINKLATKEEIADTILKCTNKDNGRLIRIGKD